MNLQFMDGGRFEPSRTSRSLLPTVVAVYYSGGGSLPNNNVVDEISCPIIYAAKKKGYKIFGRGVRTEEYVNLSVGINQKHI